MLKKSLFIFGLCLCCHYTFADAVLDGVQCDDSMEGKVVIASDSIGADGPMSVFTCHQNDWVYDDHHWDNDCFDYNDVAQPGVPVSPSGLTAVSVSSWKKEAFYVDTTKAKRVKDSTLYEYSDDKDVMCVWCSPTAVVTVTDYGYWHCVDTYDEAWCMFAKNKKNENVKWQDNKCECLTEGQTWDNDKHRCVLPDGSVVRQEKYGFKCTQERVDKSYVFMDSDAPLSYKCLSDGTWEESEYWINRCFDINENTVEKPGPSGFKIGASNDYWCAYVNPNTQEIADKVYEYNPDTNVMCHWVTPGRYASYSGDTYRSFENKDEAWCMYAKYKDGIDNEKIKWEDNECKCTEKGQTWNNTKHTCVYQAMHNFECTPERYNHQYIFLDEEESYYLYKCLSDGTWEKSDRLGFCYEINENSIGKPAPTGFDKSNPYRGWATYIKTGTQPIISNIYEHTNDTNIMCLWVDSERFLSLTKNGKRTPYESLDEAWCMYAKYKDGIDNEKIKWEDNECKCTEEGQTWDTTEHKCKPKTESDKKEESNNNAQQTCEQKYPNNPTARACCNAGETVAEWNEATKQCKCKDSKKEWKNNNCEEKSVLTKEKAEAAKKVVQQFVKNTSDKASKWKDVEGNFNTARLASDLTAGVVLGTVGGVVSGVVIKKKQIEKGFEVLHCAIGGQPVADWGDTFTIGLKRY